MPGAAAKVANRDYRLVEMYTFVAVVYFIISFGLSTLVKQLQARIAIECIGNSDALYHNVEHTMLVTLADDDRAGRDRALVEVLGESLALLLVQAREQRDGGQEVRDRFRHGSMLLAASGDLPADGGISCCSHYALARDLAARRSFHRYHSPTTGMNHGRPS
mgnify:CR=1 FL=1